MATVKKTPAKKTSAKAEEKPVKKAVKKTAAEAPKPAKKAAAKTAKPEAPAKKAVKKAEAVIEAPVVEAPAEKPAESAARKPVAGSRKPEAGLPAHAQAILTAIQEGRALEFIFADADANAPRTFEPRQLTFDALSQAWYVWGWDRRYNAERFHRIDLLSEVNAVEGVGRSAQGPYKEGTPGNQIGGWLGGEPIPVKVLLHKQWVFAVKQAPPAFPEFKLVEVEDGKAQVSFTATDLRAIARWVLQFGDGVTIQEPARLLDRVKQVASVWLGKDAKAPMPARQEAPKAAAAPQRQDRHEGRSEPRHEGRPEPRHEGRSDSKPEGRPEHRPERHREQHHREREPREETKSSNPKVEIRFDRL
ncbi:MAG TPA: WYL domain-containing protein [Holophagaceae bacterium]|nr:WYL domain-containing protein [Holophagaceae bacterium]